MNNIIIVATLLGLAQAASASVDEKDIAKCAVITGDLARLECFDSLAKTKGLSAPQNQPTPVAGKGKWRCAGKSLLPSQEKCRDNRIRSRTNLQASENRRIF